MPRENDLDALLTRAQEGDVRAFEDLLRAHLPQIRRFARALAPVEADADDLAQEALVKVYKSIRLFRYQSAFSTWLYAVVRNTFLDAAKSRAGRQRGREDALEDRHARTKAEAPLADEQLSAEEEKERLWRALRRVPPEFRSALVLFDLEGRSYDELSAIEGVPVGTVKSRLFRGRALLRKILGEEQEGAVSAGTSSETAPSKAQGRSR
ncbi:MAG TPA: sigma-70 family RNA polymerase sigma factor [Myxococcales bacterium]